jgi:hypothetical protein
LLRQQVRRNWQAVIAVGGANEAPLLFAPQADPLA